MNTVNEKTKFPLSLIITLVAATGAGSFWIAGLSHRVDDNSQIIARQEARLLAYSDNIATIRDKLSGIEFSIKLLNSTITKKVHQEAGIHAFVRKYAQAHEMPRAQSTCALPGVPYSWNEY